MRKIRIAQIGTSRNSHGISIWNSLKKQSDIFEICGYAMPEGEKEKFPEQMTAFKDYTELTLDEIMKDPSIEAVAIETEEIYLTKYAILAAENKKHIHMEKPGGTVLSDFERLIEAVKKNKTAFHLGYMYRYNPYIKSLIDRVKSGELGEIISVEAQMSGYHPTELRSWLKTFSGGIMFFLGCHLVDLILQIQGKPERIIPLNKSTGLDNIDSTDFGMAVFEYKNGVSFAKTTDIEHGGFLRRQLVVTGTKGMIEVRPLEENVNYPGTITHFKENFDKSWNAKAETRISEEFDRYDNMLISFAQIAAGEKENPYSCDYELELYKTVLECCGVDSNR
ncbi:MAG: Gfo/Idh/MocA family oxidoreductase [Ruminococcaceae bacterium]|nr:Gfo/Idh/MocA family oxidoreductase [Oscillospiraceae bacterium]